MTEETSNSEWVNLYLDKINGQGGKEPERCLAYEEGRCCMRDNKICGFPTIPEQCTLRNLLEEEAIIKTL